MAMYVMFVLVMSTTCAVKLLSSNSHDWDAALVPRKRRSDAQEKASSSDSNKSSSIVIISCGVASVIAVGIVLSVAIYLKKHKSAKSRPTTEPRESFPQVPLFPTVARSRSQSLHSSSKDLMIAQLTEQLKIMHLKDLQKDDTEKDDISNDLNSEDEYGRWQNRKHSTIPTRSATLPRLQSTYLPRRDSCRGPLPLESIEATSFLTSGRAHSRPSLRATQKSAKSFSALAARKSMIVQQKDTGSLLSNRQKKGKQKRACFNCQLNGVTKCNHFLSIQEIDGDGPVLPEVYKTTGKKEKSKNKWNKWRKNRSKSDGNKTKESRSRVNKSDAKANDEGSNDLTKTDDTECDEQYSADAKTAPLRLSQP